ncbi:hypothetical protein [Haloarcula argentinensis]|uniref:Uncharacterized protein n=1 Tax=Haloarcula argentinensis TaxID=43776 RepID=A0A830FNY8_HALAR|nr:hypothetical protein [Haloarcula argentinensis]EMA19218.1 hypothetical protein C443_16406 [Haloarcula argentinensis DSM 12282]MDS0254291.1 hypothetical protein [Haloarcula argentinensis]GGM42830.1 hypothetical protein GCM10009006_25130 [Haloarcula argentinensis]
MDQLSSCYFCGGALDVSLSEYPIIPKSLDPEAEKQGTVVLCSTCREKLATIVEPAVEAAKTDARETAETAGDAGTAESPGLLDESETPTTGEQTTDKPTTTDSVVEPADDGSLLGDDSASVAEQEQSTRSPENEDTASEPDEADAAVANTTDRQTAESAASSGSAARTESGDTERGSDSDDNDGSDDSPSLTKLEYNKVMRLLQNREMPVDRAEIREVAVNAYDIDGEQFDAIIDAAVDRDLIGQENGQLVESNG